MVPFLEVKILIPHCRTSFVDDAFVIFLVEFRYSYLLTPNVNYSGRTAPLTSKVTFYIFIQQI